MLNFIHHTKKKYGLDQSKEITEYFNKVKKIETTKAGIAFIKRCLDNNKKPDFTRINLASNNQREDTEFIHNLRLQVSEDEYKKKRKRLRELEVGKKVIYDRIQMDLNLEQPDIDTILALEREKISKMRAELAETHKRKLSKLGVIDIPDDRHVSKRRGGLDKVEEVDMADAIFNLSTRELTDLETRVLSKGLKFGIKAKKVDTFEILTRFELLAESLDFLPIKENSENERNILADLNSKSNFLQQLQTMSLEFLELSKQAQDSLTDEERAALIELAKDKSIVISKADKGNAVVIQNLQDYKNKVSELIADDSKFRRLRNNVTETREKGLVTFLRKLYRKNRSHRIEVEVYRRIYPKGSRAGVLYGLPKVHKSGNPVRPIISAIKTYNYELAKYLDEILKPLIDTTYILVDTYDFVNKVKDLSSATDLYIVSFDIVSLFTNVPTTETIDILLDLAFKENNTHFHNLTRSELQRLLVMCTQESHFQFNGEYFDQIDGVAMGSPLGPLFANAFMSNFENKHMEKLKELGLLRWNRYVDDIFSTMSNSSQAHAMLKFLNEQHPNIKFTIEHEQNNSIPFLDTRVTRGHSRYSTTIYRKKTFTGVYLNWTSLTARRYKTGLIKCLAERIWRICSEQSERLIEIEKLKTILRKNDYPPDVVDCYVSRFLESKATEPTPKEPDKPHKRFLKLPYVGRKCEEFATRLKRIVENNYPQVEFNVAFQAPNTIAKLFPFKDKIKNVEDQSLVVYNLKCSCGDEYIGKTERILRIRLQEHRKQQESSCFQHVASNPGHRIDYDNVKVLASAENDSVLRIKERLFIIDRDPVLNKQLNSQSKYEKNTIIITAYPQFRKQKE